MPLPCKTERALLDFDEYQLVRKTHLPYLIELSEAELGEVVGDLRQRRDRERTLARDKRREARGKGKPRGGNLPGTQERPYERKLAFSSALKRVTKELKRRQAVAARAFNVEAAQKALDLRRTAEFRSHPGAGESDGERFQPLPSRRKRVNLPPMRLGMISQHTKVRQAIRDSKG